MRRGLRKHASPEAVASTQNQPMISSDDLKRLTAAFNSPPEQLGPLILELTACIAASAVRLHVGWHRRSSL